MWFEEYKLIKKGNKLTLHKGLPVWEMLMEIVVIVF